MSLADALAVGTAARNVVLLGDPQQLAQVSQGIHPPGAQALGAGAPPRRRRHGSAGTVGSSSRETLADASRRLPLHLGDVLRGPAPLRAGVRAPADRLAGSPEPACAGCRSSTHGNRGSSARGSRRDRGRARAPDRRHYFDRDGREHRLGWNDVLVVTPYNAQVRCLRAAIPAAAPGSAPSTSSRARKRRSSSSRWPPRAATTSRATWSSSSRATG